MSVTGRQRVRTAQIIRRWQLCYLENGYSDRNTARQTSTKTNLSQWSPTNKLTKPVASKKPKIKHWLKTRTNCESWAPASLVAVIYQHACFRHSAAIGLS